MAYWMNKEATRRRRASKVYERRQELRQPQDLGRVEEGRQWPGARCDILPGNISQHDIIRQIRGHAIRGGTVKNFNSGAKKLSAGGAAVGRRARGCYNHWFS